MSVYYQDVDLLFLSLYIFFSKFGVRIMMDSIVISFTCSTVRLLLNLSADTEQY